MDEIGFRIVDQRSCGNMQLCKNHFNANVLIDGNCTIMCVNLSTFVALLIKMWGKIQNGYACRQI